MLRHLLDPPVKPEDDKMLFPFKRAQQKTPPPAGFFEEISYTNISYQCCVLLRSRSRV